MSIEAFFKEIDVAWGPADGTIELLLLGCGALMLRVGYARGTNDGDVLETMQLTPAIKERLLALAGKGTSIHVRTRFYLDIVGNGIPFLPRQPRWIDVPTLNASLGHFQVKALDVVDVVVSKLKRLNANDLDDIEAMANRGFVPHADLLDRFRSAYEEWSFDARAHQLPAYVDNLNQIERDILAAPETAFDLDALRY